MTTQAKSTRKNSETVHKPYRSNTSFYPDYREEVPDADYYGLKHSEFKKPWLPASGYDEMEYKFDFPLEYLNPNYIDIEVPDAGKYEFPNAPTVNPDWTPTRWNPQYPTPDFPKPKEYAKKKPGPNLGSKIVWLYCEGIDFTFCPGTTAQVQFVEYTTDPIVAIDTDLATLIRASFGRLGDSRHRPGYPEGTLTITIQIPESVNRDLNITATTESGETCVSRGTQSSSCLGCEGVSILYTSTQMMTSETQALSVSNPVGGTVYAWELTGPGSLSEQRGLQNHYQAPSTNSGCASALIRLLDYKSGQVCATLTIAINAITDLSIVAFREANNDYQADYSCAQVAPPPCDTVIECEGDALTNPGFTIGYTCTYTEYACDGSPIEIERYVWRGCPPQQYLVLTEKQSCTSYSTSCCGTGCDFCSVADQAVAAKEDELQTSCLSAHGPWGDVRTQDMKDAGCCPYQTL